MIFTADGTSIEATGWNLKSRTHPDSPARRECGRRIMIIRRPGGPNIRYEFDCDERFIYVYTAVFDSRGYRLPEPAGSAAIRRFPR